MMSPEEIVLELKKVPEHVAAYALLSAARNDDKLAKALLVASAGILVNLSNWECVLCAFNEDVINMASECDDIINDPQSEGTHSYESALLNIKFEDEI